MAGLNDGIKVATTYRLVIRYDGRAYFGWQRLKDKPTIQGALEDAIAVVVGEKISLAGAGRTDRGAHAEGQVASFHAECDIAPEVLVRGISDVLPSDIAVREATVAPATFHARMSAIGKAYEYRIWTEEVLPSELKGRVWQITEPLIPEKIEEAASQLLGSHNFASFATKAKFGQQSMVRTLSEASVSLSPGRVTLRFIADSFLQHMVRNMVRLLVKVGQGRVPPFRVSSILDAKSRDASPGSAPASGLYLTQVMYSADELDPT